MKIIEHKFTDIIMDFGCFNFFYPVFDLYDQRGNVGERDGIIFEIRPKESCHNVPHVHAKYQDKNISISLLDYSVLAGNLSKKQQKIAIQWTKDNIDKLKSKWNEYHQYRIPVF